MVQHTTAVQQLADQVSGLTLDAVAKKYPKLHPEINPYDLYRAHISNIVSDITGVDSSIVYPAVQWTQGLDKGDFVLAAPALRIKGAKPDALAKEWAAKFPENDPLIETPVPNGPFISFFAKSKPLVSTVIPMIQQLGKTYGKNPYLGLKDQNDPSQGNKRIVRSLSPYTYSCHLAHSL
jgi:arginyl-tRNA synthetase